MTKVNGWKELNELRKTYRNFSGLQYSYEYAKKNKDIKAIGGGCSDFNGEWMSVSIREQIEIKEAKSGDILFRVIGRDDRENTNQNFQTQFGVYVSNDCGEFGGELATPGGITVGGNFRFMFDLKNNVYGIDTCAHLGIAHFRLYQFSDPDHYKCLYSVGGWEQLLFLEENNGVSEDFYCAAIDVKEDEAYILLSGHVTKDDVNDGRQWWHEIRLLKTQDEEVAEVVRFVGGSISYINNIVVKNETLYIACDKMVLICDLSTREWIYLTCISEEDEKDLLNNSLERGERA